MENQKIIFPKDINLIRKVYKLFVFGLPVLFVLRLFIGFEIELFENFLISYIIILFVYFGIKTKKDWVVTLILLSSIWGAINVLTHISTESKDVVSLTVNIVFGFLAVLFYVYSFMIFSRQKTKRFFNEKGTTII